MPDEPMDRLTAEGITVRFAGLLALDEVTVSFPRGELTGLIGPNGSGKTTLLNVLSGVVRPNAGGVVLGRQRWQRRSPSKIAADGVRRTFQNIRLFEDMTVLETIEVPVAAKRGRGDRRRQALDILNQFRLVEHRDRIATELPYGLQRRLELARAAAGDPTFLLLDEPTAGLNRQESLEVVALIMDLRKRLGCGVVLVDHDLHVVMNACNWLVVLNEGRIIATGSPADVRHDPDVVKAYLG